MKYHLNGFVMTLCILSLQLPFASGKTQSPLSVSLVWNEPDSLTKKALFDSLRDGLISQIKSIETLRYIPFDSIGFPAEQSKDVLSYYRVQYNPVVLYEANKKFHVDLLIICTPQKTDSLGSLTIRAINYMSGDQIDYVNLQLTNAARGQKIIEAAFNTFVNNLFSQRSQYGFPFDQNDFGIVIVQKDAADSLLPKTIHLFTTVIERLHLEKPIRFQIIPSKMNDDSCQAICDAGKSVNQLLRASLGLCLCGSDTSARTFFMLPITDLSQPAINIELPVRPPIHELYCLPATMDSADVGHKLAAILGTNLSATSDSIFANDSEETENLPLLFAKVTSAQARWKTNSLAENDDPDDSLLVKTIRQCYQKLDGMAVDSTIISGWIALNHADFEFLSGDSDSALSLMAKTEGVFSRIADTSGLLLTNIEYGKIFNFTQDYTRARKTFTAALAMAEQRKDSVSMAQIGYNLGMLSEMQNDNEKALSYYEKSAKLFNMLGDPYKTGQIYGHLARLLRNSNRLDDSMDYAQGYLRMAKQLRSEPLTAKAHFQLGLTLLMKNNLKGAIEQFQHAADYMEILGDSSGLARVDNNLGTIYQEQENWGEAQLHFQSALQLSRASGDVANAIRSLVNLGDLATDQKKWDEAQEFYDQAQEQARTLNNPHELAIVVYAKGLAHLREGRLKMGYGEIKQAIEMGGGSVHEDAEKEQAFLKKLETLIGEIQDIQSK